jgi:DegV family protein with EDD domain
MGSIAILTDSAVQFTLPSFNGRNLVRVIPYHIQYRGTLYDGGKPLKPGELPMSVTDETRPTLVLPPFEQLVSLFSQDEAGKTYDQVLGIFSSAAMCDIVSLALAAQKLINGRTRFQIVDSQTTSVGLGILVQTAADAIAKGASLADTERLVRSFLPHIYAIFCTPGLTYLYGSGFLDRAQATVGEMLGIYPIFAIEEGHLSPLEKVRNHRQVLDFFQEFLEEFDQLQYIAFLQSAIGNNSQDGRILRDHAQDHFAKTPFSEHTVNLPIASLFGPNMMGIFVVEPSQHKPG